MIRRSPTSAGEPRRSAGHAAATTDPAPGSRVRRWLRRPHPALGYGAFALAVFLVALAYTLPHDLIAARALATATAGAPVTVTFGDVRFAFPNGYRFTGLRIAPAAAPETVVAIDELTVRTPMLGLLLGRPRRATLSGIAYGGAITGSAELRGSGAALDLRLADVDLGRAGASLLLPPARIGGRADAAIDLAGDGRTLQSLEGTATLAVRGLDLSQIAVRGLVLPELAFPEVSASAQVAGSRLQLKELRAASDAVELGATGDVLLRDPLPQSVLNLRLSLDVRPGAPPPLRMAASLLPKRPAGEKPLYTLSGPLVAPSIR